MEFRRSSASTPRSASGPTSRPAVRNRARNRSARPRGAGPGSFPTAGGEVEGPGAEEARLQSERKAARTILPPLGRPVFASESSRRRRRHRAPRRSPRPLGRLGCATRKRPSPAAQWREGGKATARSAVREAPHPGGARRSKGQLRYVVPNNTAQVRRQCVTIMQRRSPNCVENRDYDENFIDRQPDAGIFGVVNGRFPVAEGSMRQPQGTKRKTPTKSGRGG